jgi:hypothetical protein
MYYYKPFGCRLGFARDNCVASRGVGCKYNTSVNLRQCIFTNAECDYKQKDINVNADTTVGFAWSRTLGWWTWMVEQLRARPELFRTRVGAGAGGPVALRGVSF